MTQNKSEHVDLIEEYLRKVDYIIRKKGRVILSDFNITVPQFTALQILINNGDMTISELSQKMDLACSTITDLIDRMEKTNLVRRRKDEQDKRVVRVEVLQEGHDILSKVLEKRIEFLSDKLKGVAEDDKQALRTALENLYFEMKEEI
ncbi:MarR family winged helix-turn-helix transcriptional regulator [Gudongella sp. SC589]|jgi:DNA-binding MarR family transcriptional regulator|uniref:MarR family winged helix-turn-helix transcriptional regulator n=1 Tax=Gudongella sp. SC589 TaxID=3385990 RepID=UPI003904BC1A